MVHFGHFCHPVYRVYFDNFLLKIFNIFLFFMFCTKFSFSLISRRKFEKINVNIGTLYAICFKKSIKKWSKFWSKNYRFFAEVQFENWNRHSPWSHDENFKKQAYVQQYDSIYILKYVLKILSKICQNCTFLSHYVHTHVCTWKTFFFCLNFGPFWTFLSPCVQSIFR